MCRYLILQPATRKVAPADCVAETEMERIRRTFPARRPIDEIPGWIRSGLPVAAWEGGEP
jgi:hypothetical protein